MKVLTIISKLEMGGIEKTLLSCLPYLKTRNIDITVLCDVGGKLDDEYIAAGASLIDFKGYKKPFLDAVRLRQVLRAGNYDIVHSRYGHTSGVFAKTSSKMNVPFIVSIHNERAMFRNSWQRKPFLKLLRKLYLSFHKKRTFKYATLIVGHSKTNLTYYNDCPEKYKHKLRVLYNGVDFSKFSDYPLLQADKQNTLEKIRQNFNKNFIHIGKFKEQKNHGFLIDVFHALNPVQNNYSLILLGEGPLLEDMKSKVKALGIQDNVFFMGMETNIAPYLSIADIFLFPSLYEGFGNVLIEAQYAKVAIAASDIAPHYEASYKGYYKYFYDPVNVDDAVSKINRLLNEIDAELLENGFQFAEEFSIEKMAANLADIYENIFFNEDVDKQ